MRLSVAYFLLILLLSGCSYSYVEIESDNKIIKVNVEIADDNEERTKGLMFREYLGENEGMLFVFDDAQIRTFWMKNTKIPLDIIFISEDLEIINIKQAEPCINDHCRVYSSEGNAKYVLEVNRGFSERNGINSGNKLVFFI